MVPAENPGGRLAAPCGRRLPLGVVRKPLISL